MSLLSAIAEIKEETKELYEKRPVELGNELYEFSTTLSPYVNIDIIARNEEGQTLLAWRDDKWFGRGWHLPGRCIRLMESIEESVQRCAQDELGTEVSFDPAVCHVKEFILERDHSELEDPYERCHFISLCFICKVPDGYVIDNHGLKPEEPGYLAWHDAFPDDMIEVHKRYQDLWYNEASWRGVSEP